MDLARVDLNLLVPLDALLSECHVTRAADRTSVGQPAMSASLARLRRQFDDPLLVRQGRHMVRTPLADSLVGPVREALASVEQVMLRRREFDPARDHASFTIVAADYVTVVLLRPLLRALSASAPDVRISVRAFDESVDDQLRRGEIDLVIVPRELFGRRPVFPHQQLFTDRYVVVVDRDHPDVGDTVSVEQLTSMRFVAYHSGSINPIADTELETLGVELDIEVTTQSFVVAPFLIRGTRLGSITLERLAHLLAEPAGLRVVDCPLPLRTIHEEMYWNPRHTEDPAHRWLRSAITDHAGRL